MTVPVDGQDRADEAIKSIRKQYGAGAVFNMGDRVGVPVPHTPTGLWSLDQDVLGTGGVPHGRIIEIYGPASAGKTTLALQLLGQVQKMGERGAFIDVEHALDPTWAAVLGVDMDTLVVAQPDYGEQALDIACSLIESGAFRIVIIDSVAALTPKAEIEGEFGDSHMGLQARMMSQALRKLNAVVSRTGTILIFINQLRDKIGVMFGSPETTTGGKSLPFYASVRLDVRRVESIGTKEEPIGNKVKIKAAKNKCAAPFKQTTVNLLFGTGFDTFGSLVEAAVKYGVIEKTGSWYVFDNEKYQGMDTLKEGIKEREVELLLLTKTAANLQ